jgi:hypothetical protein
MNSLDLSVLVTPPSWFIVELLSVALLFICMADAIKTYAGKNAMVRIGELFGFIAYAGIYENIGVAANVYYYSLNRIVLVGRVPLSILIIEAVIFYVGMRTTEKLRMPAWTAPFLVGLLGVLQDLTLDPSACYDLHMVKGVLEGRWNWNLHYAHTLFGIPFFNFTGWFTMMFYYSGMILLGRWIFSKSAQGVLAAVAYVMLGILVSLALIVSPLNRFLLMLRPFSPWEPRTNEIVMLIIVLGVSILITLKYLRPREPFDIARDRVIWLVPVILHAYDVLAAYILKIEVAYVPSVLFALPHLVLLYYLFKRRARPVAAAHTTV